MNPDPEDMNPDPVFNHPMLLPPPTPFKSVSQSVPWQALNLFLSHLVFREGAMSPFSWGA